MRQILCGLSLLACLGMEVIRAEFPLPSTAYRIRQMEVAQKKALDEKLPVAFIVSSSAYFNYEEKETDPFSRFPAGGTHYAFKVFAGRAVIIFVEAETEQDLVPVVVSDALFRGGSGYFTPPKVVVTDPLFSYVIAMVGWTAEVQERQTWFSEALTKMDRRSVWMKAAAEARSASPPGSRVSSQEEGRRPPIFLWVMFAVGMGVLLLSGLKRYWA